MEREITRSTIELVLFRDISEATPFLAAGGGLGETCATSVRDYVYYIYKNVQEPSYSPCSRQYVTHIPVSPMLAASREDEERFATMPAPVRVFVMN
jgi:hypothetical protein